MTCSTSVPLRMRSGPPWTWAAIVLGAAVILAPASALGAVQVRGTPEAVRITAQDDSIDDVLSALGKAFDLRWQSSSPLDKRLTGTYEGSLNRVLARVLDGYNFVLKASQGQLAITVLGSRTNTTVASKAPGANTPAAAARPAAAPAAEKVSPARTAPPAPPALASAAVKAASDLPAPALISAAIVAEGPSVLPVPGAATLKAPEPQPSTVPPPMPGMGMDKLPSAVLLPGPVTTPVPHGGVPSGGIAPPMPKS